MGLFAVALILPDEIGKELDLLRGEYSKHMVYIPIPHITLMYPFESNVDRTTLNTKLETVAKMTRQFTIVLSGIRYFDKYSNVAYIAIENKEPLIDLRMNIIKCLKGIFKIEEQYEKIDSPETFTPHLTIGEAIPNEIFPIIKKEFVGL